jgi:hypothetical protein
VRRSGLFDAENGGAETRARRNVLIVMVESWGQLKDPGQRALVEAPFKRPTVAERYTMSTGVTPYYGSTTSGELRELCGEWGSYRDYLGRPAAHCLPARLGEAGYRTVAFHGFAGRMFDRGLWYPNIGFQESLFAEELWQPGERICTGVFTGACDTDIAEDVGRALLGANGTPQLVYWLTLNSHLPVHPDFERRFLDCEGPDGPFRNEQVCRLAELWIQVFDRVAEMVTAPGLPPTDVLIVADHPPPFWSHEGRAHFVPGEVPWILLRSPERRPLGSSNFLGKREKSGAGDRIRTHDLNLGADEAVDVPLGATIGLRDSPVLQMTANIECLHQLPQPPAAVDTGCPLLQCTVVS